MPTVQIPNVSAYIYYFHRLPINWLQRYWSNRHTESQHSCSCSTFASCYITGSMSSQVYHTISTLWECMITVASVSFICNKQGTNNTVPYRVTIHLTKTFPNSLGLPRDTVEGYTFHPPSLLISSVTPKLSHLNFIKWERCQARFQPTKQANSSCSRQARDFKILVIAMSISVVWPNIMSLLWQQIIYYLPRK